MPPGMAQPYSGPGRTVAAACGPGSSFMADNLGWPGCGTWTANPRQATVDRNAVNIWHWGPWAATNPITKATQYAAGTKLTRLPGVNYAPVGFMPVWPGFNPGTAPAPSPHPANPSPSVPVPRAAVPDLQDGPGRQTGPRGPRQRSRHTYRVARRPWGEPDPGTDPEDPRPPRPNEREKKMRAPAALRAALSAAYAATETADVIEALFDALPKHIQKTVPKTGRLGPGARLAPGTPYASVSDKARHLYDNWEQLDVNEAAWNLLQNHVTDEIIGRLFGGADQFANKHLFGSRFVFI